jgi:hypothetical protein
MGNVDGTFLKIKIQKLTNYGKRNDFSDFDKLNTLQKVN